MYANVKVAYRHASISNTVHCLLLILSVSLMHFTEAHALMEEEMDDELDDHQCGMKC